MRPGIRTGANLLQDFATHQDFELEWERNDHGVPVIQVVWLLLYHTSWMSGKKVTHTQRINFTDQVSDDELAELASFVLDEEGIAK